jgi:hypothetical protein
MHRAWQRIAESAVPILFLALSSAQAEPGMRGFAGEDWKTFAIPEYGTNVQYPAGIFSVSEGKPEQGTGERLRTQDGRASLSIYSRANDSGETPRSYLRHYLRFPPSALEYQRVTGSFFAISAVTEDTIYYSRCNFSGTSGGSIHCFDIVYPQREKQAWDSIVTRISLSLRPLHG